MIGGIRGRFPDGVGPADIDEALESLPAQLAAGFGTICFKPSMYVDDARDIGAFCRSPRTQGRGDRVMTEDRVLLVTGAGSGIGAAVAERAARDGWRVVVCGRRARARSTRWPRRPGATPIVVDVTDAAAVADLVAATVEQLGRLDCVVANAGVMTHRHGP